MVQAGFLAGPLASVQCQIQQDSRGQCPQDRRDQRPHEVATGSDVEHVTQPQTKKRPQHAGEDIDAESKRIVEQSGSGDADQNAGQDKQVGADQSEHDAIVPVTLNECLTESIIDTRSLSEEVVAAARQTMPFGKYKGRALLDLPEYYLVWFHQRGFPAGRLGRQMALMHEIRINRLENLVRSVIALSDQQHAAADPAPDPTSDQGADEPSDQASDQASDQVSDQVSD